MYFCEDAELLAWEPGVFAEEAFAHQAILKQATGTLTGTSLVMDPGVLTDVLPGMVMEVALSDASASQWVEVVEITDTTHATVSALRGRSTEEAVPPLLSGAVKVTVVTFRPQIGAVGDALLALIGVASDRDTTPTPAFANAAGFKPAAIFGTLAAIYRTLAATTEATNITLSKQAFYEGLFQAARQTLSALVDRDDDGIPETRIWSGVGQLVRA